jgi:uncharacterized protein (DUF1330 family)
MDTLLTPSEAQLSKLMSLPSETPLAVLNLFEFNLLANYQPEDPEYGTDAAKTSGEAAYRRYGEIAQKVIQNVGGRVVFSSAADQVLIGPEDANWHVAAIMYFPSRRAFMQMMADPDFQQTSRHRKAALKRHHMIHLNGEAFRE